VDEKADNKGSQRFEKAVSGMYIGQILREVFPEDGFDEHTDGRRLLISLMLLINIKTNT